MSGRRVAVEADMPPADEYGNVGCVMLAYPPGWLYPPFIG